MSLGTINFLNEEDAVSVTALLKSTIPACYPSEPLVRNSYSQSGSALLGPGEAMWSVIYITVDFYSEEDEKKAHDLLRSRFGGNLKMIMS